MINLMDSKKQINELKALVESLKAKVSGLEKNELKLKKQEFELKAKIEDLEISNDWFREQLRIAQLHRFGSSSEKTQILNQLSLFNETENLSDESVPEPEMEQVTYRRKKSKGKREEFYKNFSVKQTVYELSPDECICKDCKGVLHACGEEVHHSELEVIPAQAFKVKHIQKIYSCRNCEKNSKTGKVPMVKAPVPKPVIKGSGIASPSLVSLVTCNKFVLALPLRRQEKELKRMGIDISCQTLSNWVNKASLDWLSLIYDLLHEEYLKLDIGHADETTVQVIKEDGRKSSQKSYMWVYTSGKHSIRPIVLFDYQQTRQGMHTLNFLDGFEGFLHVDAYAGYRKLEELRIILVECWAHARRKFDEALKAMDKKDRTNSQAKIGFDYCNKLFELERKYDKLLLSPEDRFRQRELESRPITEKFFEWAESMLPGTHSKSKFGRAVRYAVNQRSRLNNFFLDGRLEISNNLAERSVRPFAVGRKNWMFIYSSKGAKASAIAYSIIQTAQANGLVPFIYLDYLFQKLPNMEGQDISCLLPWDPEIQKICRVPSSKEVPS